MSKKNVPTPKAVIWLEGEVVFHDVWWKVWKTVLNIVNDNKNNPGTEIVIEIQEIEE